MCTTPGLSLSLILPDLGASPGETVLTEAQMVPVLTELSAMGDRDKESHKSTDNYALHASLGRDVVVRVHAAA